MVLVAGATSTVTGLVAFLCCGEGSVDGLGGAVGSSSKEFSTGARGDDDVDVRPQKNADEKNSKQLSP
jgi:hypothetical protein